MITLGGAALAFAGGQQEAGEAQPKTSVIVEQGTYNEAPMLRTMVEAGQLPPVDERLPSNPAVVEPDLEIGTYGGVIQLAAINKTEWGDFQSGMNGAQGFFKLAPDGSIINELVADYDISDDQTTFTFRLREGVRWSDGEPFTSEDIMFAIEDKLLNTDLSPTPPPYLMADGQLAEISAPDDYTVRFQFATANPKFVLEMTRFFSWQQHLIEPKHYLSKWHADYNDEAVALAKDEGFETWTEAFDWHRNLYSGQNDLDLPRLEPYIIVDATASRKVFERNPYYYKVDTEGNQLPYLDGMEVAIVSNREVHDLKVLNGEVDFATQRLNLESFPIYKRNENSAGYQVYMLPGTSTQAIYLNQNYREDTFRELFADVRFRQALSLSLDRESINEALYFGQALSRQATALPSASFYRDEWGDHFAQFDLERAADLMSEIGFEEKNRQGIYLMDDGSPLTLVIEYFDGQTSTNELEMIKSQLEKAGIGVALRNQPRELLFDRLDANDQIMVEYFDWKTTEYNIYSNPGNSLIFSDYGRAWGAWMGGNRAQGSEPPEDVKDFYELVQDWGKTIYGSDEYIEVAQEIFDRWQDYLFVVGVVASAPHPMIVKEGIGNVVVPAFASINPAHIMTRVRDQVFFK